jgi:hypothetical protein
MQALTAVLWQIMESDRTLSQYSIGRGETGLFRRLSRRHRAHSAPPNSLPIVFETSTKLADWRQRFIEVRRLLMIKL